MKTYEQKIEKIKQAAEKREKRLLKRLQIAKGKPRKVGINALKRELRRITHKIVRQSGSACYVCDKPLPNPKDRTAGHYWSDGGHSAVRYSFDNLRISCVNCNSFKSGNLAEYGMRLERELGHDNFEALGVLAHQTKRWERTELELLIEERKKLL